VVQALTRGILLRVWREPIDIYQPGGSGSFGWMNRRCEREKFMQIQVNTDNHIKGREDVVRLVHSCLEGAVGRFADRITRVEVHLSDTNSHKSGGDDKRCVLEARLAGLQPLAVSHQATTIELAVTEAADKLERSVESTLGRLHDR